MKKLTNLVLAFSCCFFIGSVCLAQVDNGPIKLINSSFEDAPKQSAAPLGWTDCGFQGESAPDVHPNGYWEVKKPAQHGTTYMGLVVRHNDTWERVSQLLERPLKGGTCYNFSIYLSSSDNYRSGTNNRDNYPAVTRSDSTYNFDVPAVLRIWGGSVTCGRTEMLAQSNPVDHGEWRIYQFRLKPKADLRYIMLEAFFKTPVLTPYNGNILVDNASVITPVDCEVPIETPKIAAPTPPTKPKPNVVVNKPVDNSPTPPVVFTPKPKVGEIIKINNLYFKADSDSIPPNSYKALDDIFNFLTQNSSLIVEIGGHTNGLPKDDFCDSLSTLRAKAVAEYLINKGIDKKRMTYVGYGRRKPIDTNATREGRTRNQRVELKILSS